MGNYHATFPNLSEQDTLRLAARLALSLRRGDTILLHGPIGAGKSTLARAVIRTRLGDPVAEVPSPTFTLVQTYPQEDGDIWHCDLYRLTCADELLELGLEEAFETEICLIEWPEKLSGHTPPDALNITLSAELDGHTAQLSGQAAWASRLAGLHV